MSWHSGQFKNGWIKTMTSGIGFELPRDLPIPVDDGACNHLQGMSMPSVNLLSTRDRTVNIEEISSRDAVFFFYPMTGKPGVPLPKSWDLIPGARGCTPESCSYRDHYREFRDLGFEVFGISSQSTGDQKEFSERSKIPYEILSDSKLELAKALRLPTFTVEEVERPLIKRITLVTRRMKIEKVFYPVFPPDKNADQVLEYLRGP